MSYRRPQLSKPDASKQTIVDELRALHFEVIHLGRPVDLLVRHFSWPLNVWVMGECKTPNAGKLKLRKDQQEQQEFCSWHGVPYWTCGEDAIGWLQEQRWERPRMETSAAPQTELPGASVMSGCSTCRKRPCECQVRECCK